jgi:hypothetical protein
VAELGRAGDLPAFLVGLFPGVGDEIARIAREYGDTPGIRITPYLLDLPSGMMQKFAGPLTLMDFHRAAGA